MKALLARLLSNFGQRYDYDTAYMKEVLDVNAAAFLKLSLLQGMTNHRKVIPVEPYYAAKLVTVISEDCGPCTQLAVNMALEAGVDDKVITDVIHGNLDALPDDTKLVVRFTRLVLAHDPRADQLREVIEQLWGKDGLISLAFNVSTARVYPTLKYVLGHGQACQRVMVGERPITTSPQVPASSGTTMP